MIGNAFLIALREIRRNLTRSFLTVIGIVIGVASVVTMVTLGRSATEAVKKQISRLGDNLLVLSAGQRWWSSGEAPLFSMRDMEAIGVQIPGVARVAPVVFRKETVVFGENDFSSDIQGTIVGFFAMSNWELASGRFFTDEEVTDGSAVCVIGETVRNELFGPGVDPVGARIRVGPLSLEVVGLTLPKGQFGGGEDLDDNVIVPYTCVLGRMVAKGDGRVLNRIMISAEEGYPSALVVSDVGALMRERRSLAPNEDNDFSVFDAQQVAEIVSATTRVMTSLLGAVAGVSLLVGGIGIMNIMLVSVTERTREIGIRMATGARAREVMLQFLVEAVTLSFIGGVAGLLLAYVLCGRLEDLVGAKARFYPGINLVAFLFSGAIGVLFGFIPARRAASLDPIEALRHE
jgi:putative ABC transport system permease protein